MSKSSNVDTIEDFNIKDDTIRPDSGIFTALNAGKLFSGAFYKASKRMIRTAASSTTARRVRCITMLTETALRLRLSSRPSARSLL
jgi:hypothetical protein